MDPFILAPVELVLEIFKLLKTLPCAYNLVCSSPGASRVFASYGSEIIESIMAGGERHEFDDHARILASLIAAASSEEARAHLRLPETIADFTRVIIEGWVEWRYACSRAEVIAHAPVHVPHCWPLGGNKEENRLDRFGTLHRCMNDTEGPRRAVMWAERVRKLEHAILSELIARTEAMRFSLPTDDDPPFYYHPDLQPGRPVVHKVDLIPSWLEGFRVRRALWLYIINTNLPRLYHGAGQPSWVPDCTSFIPAFRDGDRWVCLNGRLQEFVCVRECVADILGAGLNLFLNASRPVRQRGLENLDALIRSRPEVALRRYGRNCPMAPGADPNSAIADFAPSVGLYTTYRLAKVHWLGEVDCAHPRRPWFPYRAPHPHPPPVVLFKTTKQHHELFPFRRLGLFIWDLRRMSELGIIQDESPFGTDFEHRNPGPGEERGLRSRDLNFVWGSMLVAEVAKAPELKARLAPATLRYLDFREKHFDTRLKKGLAVGGIVQGVPDDVQGRVPTKGCCELARQEVRLFNRLDVNRVTLDMCPRYW